ncbi:MAG: cobalamin synthesis protein P47K [Eubacterium sp.]|nr:cobalamin synthesis protein P47K [Eubacterium sp.]
MKQTKLIPVGGFLGAGKTSMLYRAAELLQKKGNRVGLITNDQATNLVDTTVLSGNEMPVSEVSGSCFCCNFPGLVQAIESVAFAIDGGITIAEPVGSCTDLSATIMQPLKDKHKELVDPAPMTVLADPERLRGILDEKENTASYIATKQFDEADIILINKIDVLDAADAENLAARAKERWPQAKVMTASVKENIGVQEWLDEVLRPQEVGKNLATVDYDLYADGEAAYGWLNATYTFEPAGQDFAADAAAFLDALEQNLNEKNAAVGHVKFLLRSGEKQYLGNLTGMADHKTIREEAVPAFSDGEEEADADTLVVNARAEIGPKALQDLILAAIDKVFSSYTFTGTDICTLIPGRPNPTYHYDHVV